MYAHLLTLPTRLPAGQWRMPATLCPQTLSASPDTAAAAADLLQLQQQQQQPQRPPAIAAPAGQPITSLQQLPPDVAKATALLEAPNPNAPGGKTQVYVLGVSHVSRVSCNQAKQLIRAVKPEVCLGAESVVCGVMHTVLSLTACGACVGSMGAAGRDSSPAVLLNAHCGVVWCVSPHTQVVMVEVCKDRVGLLVDAQDEDRRLETWHCRCVACVCVCGMCVCARACGVCATTAALLCRQPRAPAR
jgi:hypothetical protein